jgi:hypothetical protein
MVVVTGCQGTFTRTFELRDPHAVTVQTHSDSGTGDEIVPAATESQDITVPPGHAYSSARRDSDGGISFYCAICGGSTSVFQPGPVVESWDSRDPVPPLLIHGDTVTMRHVRITYATPTWSDNVAFNVDLVTHLSNVVSIRRDSYDLHRSGTGWVIGGLAIIAGAVALGYFMYSVHPDAAQGYGAEGYALAGLSAVLGGGVTWHGISLLATPNEHFQEWPTR